MSIVKHRLIAIDHILNGKKSTSYDQTNIEFIYLQIRLILETIILSTVAANNKLYSEFIRTIKKEWNIDRIMNKIKRHNPNYYPKPIIMNKKEQSFCNVSLDYIYLTEEDYKSIYIKCGNWLHVGDVSRSQKEKDYINEFKNVKLYYNKINNLLFNHTIYLDDNSLYFIDMHKSEERFPSGMSLQKVISN